MKLKEHFEKSDVLALESPYYDAPKYQETVLASIGKGRRVLDLGSSGGRISKLIQDQKNEVQCIELNAKAALRAQERGLKVKVFDLNDGIPFQDSFFEVVHAGRVIESIYDSKFLFEECNRVLKPNGVFLFSFQNLNSISNRVKVLRGDYLGSVGAYPEDHNGEHIRIFNLEKIRELCKVSGFKITDIKVLPKQGNLGLQLLNPIIQFLPAIGDVLFIKAKRMDQ